MSQTPQTPQTERPVILGLKDCHARGVDSIILGRTDDGRLRCAFIARPEHDLWRNDCRVADCRMAVGFHPHHCDLRIDVLDGYIDNVVLAHTWPTPPGIPAGYSVWTAIRLTRFRYQSPIVHGDSGRFDQDSPADARVFYHVTGNRFGAGEGFDLAAKVAHTIVVTRGQGAIWMVTEGDEDPGYQPFVWSDRDLTKESLEGMYVPMSEAEYSLNLAVVSQLLAERGRADSSIIPQGMTFGG